MSEDIQLGEPTPAARMMAEARGTLIGAAIEEMLEKLTGAPCGFVLVYRPAKKGVGDCDLISNGGSTPQVILTLEVGIAMLEKKEEKERNGTVRASGEERRDGKGSSPERE